MPNSTGAQQSKISPVPGQGVSVAHTGISPWTSYERFNVSFERVASGWAGVDPHRAASSIHRSLGFKLNPVDEKPTPGRLFMAGEMGYVKAGAVDDTLNALSKGLDLAGTLRPRLPAKSLAGSYVSADQIVDGMPIFGAQLTLHLNLKGEAYAVVGTPAPVGLKIRRPSKRIEPEAAAGIVAGALGTKLEGLTYTAQPVLLPVEEELWACWRVEAATWKPLGVWYGFVGEDGGLLALYNVASSATATAKCFKVNPFRGPLEPLQLTNLDSPPVSLTGTTSQVWGTNRSRVSSNDGSFFYEPNSEEFDQPQLYYFLQFCRSSVDSIAAGRMVGFVSKNQKFNPMKGTVHVSDAANNAYYWPSTGELFFGDVEGDPARYSSRSLDIVLHEFGHAVSDSICELGRASSNNQSRAMSEGYSDYFSATVLDNPVIGDYFDGDPKGGRRCDNANKFPRGFAGEEHDVGSVWAGFLWDLRNTPTVGKEVTDSIMLESLTYLGPWRTILQGVDALLQADRDLFADANTGTGKHEEAIREAFTRRQP